LVPRGSGDGTIYLEKWNEGKFAVAAMRLAVQHLLAPERQKRMLEEIVRRTHEIVPVKAAQLRNEPAPSGVSPAQDDCIPQITNAAVRGVTAAQLRSRRNRQRLRPKDDGVLLPFGA